MARRTSCPSRPRSSGAAAVRPRRPSGACAPRVTPMNKRSGWLLSTALLAGGAQAQLFHDATRGEGVEHQLPADRTFTPWVRDPSVLGTQAGDRVELREVAAEGLETVKLTNLVPPVHFESGVAE